ncbi:MAG: CopD family protein [Gammaproteobacteria bacterium]|nr:CopD family protein [Gammaproteobacteria bacterium]
MTFGFDVLAELTRLSGVVVVATAVALGLLHDWPRNPFAFILIGTALLAVGCVLVIIATVAPIANRLEEPVLALALEYFQTTTHGPQLLTPILPAIYALLLAEGLRIADAPGFRRGLHWMLAVTVVAMLALMAASGHVAVTDWDHIGMFLQIVHMSAAVAWVAIVLALLPRLWARQPVAGELARIGDIALALVIILFVTGIASAWLHGATLPWSLAEEYNRLLLLKTATLLLALAAAGWNRFIELPNAAGPETRIRRVLGFETIVLLLALLLAAWLTRTPPP